MVDVVLTKQRIEPGKTERLEAWAREIRDRESEAIETLRNERMHSETAFVEHADDGDYLVYYMKAEDIDAAYEAYEESSHDIDEEHKRVLTEVLETGENVGEYDLLYHLDNPDRGD
ncbi:DUF6176 family protein [Halorubrum distributum]|uniref:DUF4242 domain-containing protein n=1 Tax=Halorubrum distributum TaxID=29283 RepID=A0A6B1IKV4_9EURY|nr:DUF6176 family protein [Halorubrum terrestre]MYL16370.1 hypothetical protein [Halorubrum terrestre]MYL67073.1 hypothetical protein [Halorubrum terrestre]